MKRVLAIVLLFVTIIVLCSCIDRRMTVNTYSNQIIHIERYYQANGNLFCTRETNLETGSIVSTYFYWEWDDHGRCTLERTESITFDKNGQIVSHETIPGI